MRFKFNKTMCFISVSVVLGILWCAHMFAHPPNPGRTLVPTMSPIANFSESG